MILLFTLIISILFIWGQFGTLKSLNETLVIPPISGILAIVTFVVVLVSYFVAPLQQLKTSAYLNYFLASLSIFVLIVQTGGDQSPYFALLITTLPLSSLLGFGGTITSSLLFSGFLGYQYLVVGMSPSQTVELSIVGGVAILAGFLLWGRSEDSPAETKEDMSYHELASQLSQVAGKSEAVIKAIGDGVIALSSKGVIQLINPAAERIIGWESHDALNLSYQSVLKVLNTKDQPIEDINDPVAQAINTNKPVKTDSLSIETHSGKSFLASISVSPVGQPGDGVIIVFRDITAERSDERQRAEFISTASHEMRTPVASIEGYLGLVLNPHIATVDEKARDYITKAHASAQHLGRLFSDLLDVSKADDSRLKNDPKVVDVIPFVHDIVEGLTPKAVEKGLVILYKPIPDNSDRKVELSERRMTPVYYANVDNDHLREIVQNLVENAIKYTPKGEVTIDVGGDDTHVVVSVADTGIGIPREDQAHLFQKFYRVDNSDTREIGGTGLGLYLCRRLAETIGGRLTIDSEYKKGSTFSVELPRIGHDEATRLIEQASVEAERAAQIASSKVIHESTGPQIAETVETQPAAFDTAASQIPVTAPTPAVESVPVPTPINIPITVAPPEPPAAIYQASEPIQAPIVETIAFGPTALPQPNIQTVPLYQTSPSVNTSLDSIEANPGEYLANRRAQATPITVPQRGQ